MITPGDTLTVAVDTFGTLHFDPPAAGSVAAVSKTDALAAVPSDLMQDKNTKAYAKLATWRDDSAASQSGASAGPRRVLVWLVVEPSMPGAQPTGAPGGAPADQASIAEYYGHWPIDVFAMVDASSGSLINGVMQYGVT